MSRESRLIGGRDLQVTASGDGFAEVLRPKIVLITSGSLLSPSIVKTEYSVIGKLLEALSSSK